MKIITALCSMILLFTISNFSQTATKIDEFGWVYCGELDKLSNIYQSGIENQPQNKIYIIYYEGPSESILGYNAKTKKLDSILENPQFGNALNRAKEIPLYLKMVYKVPNERFVIIDGGYRERFVMEIWRVPEDAEIPKPTPTLTRKYIKFAKGKSKKTRSMACCYKSC